MTYLLGVLKIDKKIYLCKIPKLINPTTISEIKQLNDIGILQITEDSGRYILNKSVGDINIDNPAEVMMAMNAVSLLRSAIMNLVSLNLYNPEKGCSLGAPQIRIRQRVFASIFPGMDEPAFFLNPVMTDPSGSEKKYEGCYSDYERRHLVARPIEVCLTWMDENFTKKEALLQRIPTRIVSHEIDHLDGVMAGDIAEKTVSMDEYGNEPDHLKKWQPIQYEVRTLA